MIVCLALSGVSLKVATINDGEAGSMDFYFAAFIFTRMFEYYHLHNWMKLKRLLM